MYNNQTTFNPYAQNTAIVKDYFKRPKVLFMAILYFISVILSVASIFTMSDSLSDSYIEMFNEIGLAEAAQAIQSFSANGGDTIYTTISMIPSLAVTVLTAIAFLLIYFKSKNQNPEASPKGGFVIMFIISIFQLVASIFAVAMILLIFVVFAIVFASLTNIPYSEVTAEDQTILFILLGVIFVVFALLMVLMLVYAIGRFNFYKSVKNSVTSVTLSSKGAGAFGISSIILAIMEILFVVPSLVLVLIMTNIPIGGQMLSMESTGLTASAFTITCFTVILTGIVCFTDASIALGYKRYIKKFTRDYSSPTQPIYTQPQPAYNRAPYEHPIAQVQQTNVCPQCGTTCKEGDSFCMSCGTKIK